MDIFTFGSRFSYQLKLLGGHIGKIVLLLPECSKGKQYQTQAHPENYKDLVVRVAGYSAMFTELAKEVHDDIISRTEQHF